MKHLHHHMGSVCRILKSNLVLTRDCRGSIRRVCQSNLVMARDFCGSICKVLEESKLVLARDCRGFVCKVLESNLVCWQVMVHVCHDNHGQSSKGECYGNKGNQRSGLNWYAWYTKGEILPSGNHLHLKSLKFLVCLDISAK